ncbi:hypothetical protein ILUMI_06320 [Ignelater luminosus]|uniref:Sodium-coupled monocarboxylate transporter 1 n=1 Tax=Ignelater luminosus TaxID=2038154 RepID=A0A8K0DBC1_IGNLU|nr:hypothetical protein ILUMI_06320 [Ignelater luminosus]
MDSEADLNSTFTANASQALLLFSWVDYALFSLMFGLSGIIGIYYGCFGNKQATTKDYLHGGKTMKTFPVAMSLMASNLSGISLLGIPSEMYMFGTQYSVCILAAALMVIVINYIYLPVFYTLQLNSTYEYLKIRFSNKIRMIASVLFVISTFLYIPIVIYVPALAFNQVTGVDLYIITPIVSFICIFYTTLGGLKAVVWTDTLQFSVTLLTLGFVLIMGAISVGGFATVWERAEAGERLQFFNLNPDPTLRASFWSVVIGHVASWMLFVGCNPTTVQRFMAVPTMKKARRSLILLSAGIIVTKAICCFSGLIMYAKYHDCDPFTTGRIKRADQILAYYVLDVASQIPGISGLFVAGVFSTALSTLSTFLNSLAGIIYTDFIGPFMPADTSELKSSNIMKATVVITGFMCVCLVFIVEKLGSVLELSIRLSAVTSGPLLGLFTLGMIFPSANEKGATWGGIVSFLILGWIILKNQLHMLSGTIKHPPLSLNVSGCDSQLNATYVWTTTTTMAPPVSPTEDDEPFWLFKISFYYYTFIGAVIAIVVGLLVSRITRSDDDPDVDPNLLCPFVQKYLQKSTKTIEYTSVDTTIDTVDMNEKENKVEGFDCSFNER